MVTSSFHAVATSYHGIDPQGKNILFLREQRGLHRTSVQSFQSSKKSVIRPSNLFWAQTLGQAQYLGVRIRLGPSGSFPAIFPERIINTGHRGK